MAARTTPQKTKRKKSGTSPPPAQASSAISIAAQNLINMAVIFAVSGTILLGLLAARHF
jgi:hypothetical protein